MICNAGEGAIFFTGAAATGASGRLANLIILVHKQLKP
jgi:hypothetical protein